MIQRISKTNLHAGLHIILSFIHLYVFTIFNHINYYYLNNLKILYVIFFKFIYFGFNMFYKKKKKNKENIYIYIHNKILLLLKYIL